MSFDEPTSVFLMFLVSSKNTTVYAGTITFACSEHSPSAVGVILWFSQKTSV